MPGIENLMFKPTISDDSKFAVLAFSNLRQAHDMNTFIGDRKDYVFSTNMIDFSRGEWEKWIGERKYNGILSSNYCVVRQLVSKNPGILDSETKMLENDFVLLYQTLLISIPYASHRESFLFIGHNTEGSVDFRQMRIYPDVPHLIGSPEIVIGSEIIDQAMEIHNRVREYFQDTSHKRLFAMIGAFIKGVQSKNVAERLHQFIRCVEGFLLPDPGRTKRQFKSRTELFLGPHKHKLVNELYEIRSNIEHLHSPFELYPEVEHTTAQETIFMRALQAEYIARTLLVEILLSDDLSDLFRSEDALRTFWGDESDSNRKKLLGVIPDPEKQITKRMLSNDDSTSI